jgi:hypothetical protein
MKDDLFDDPGNKKPDDENRNHRQEIGQECKHFSQKFIERI